MIKDTESILKDYLENVNCMVEDIEEVQPLLNTNVTKRSSLCYTVLKIKGVATSAEFAFYVSGRASFNEGTGKYTSMSPPSISIYHVPGFDKYDYTVTGDYGFKNNKRTVYYKNIVVTLWAIVSGGNTSTRVYYDPIRPGITLEF